MVAFAASGIRVHLFRCPRCGERFTSKGWLLFHVSNPFTGKCLHCGIRVGSEGAVRSES
jgi:DNA-directed RNA polymerase subunit RPC12/RpoP